jgi:hypothetical protein
MSVALSIAFTGLCALVADGDGAPARILLIDAKGVGEVRGMTFPDHQPTLAVRLADLANADGSGPTRVIVAAGGDQMGLWDLRGTLIRVKTPGTPPAGVRLFAPTPDQTSWPNAPVAHNDPASWRDPRFVADMRALTDDGRIDPSLLEEGDGEIGRLPAAIASHFELEAGLLQGGLPSQEKHRSEVFEFRADGSEPALRQALTDTIQWTLESEAGAVVVEIVPVAGGPTKRLLFAPRATPHRLFVSNLPTENEPHGDARHDMSEEELAALHFAAFYKLLKEPSATMALPRVGRLPGARRAPGGLRPTTCPPVRFPSH